jgi:ribosomal protein S18 acetylase RimI-like enzyme
MKITTRKASVADIEIIRSIAEIAFRDTYRDILSAGQMDYMMEWMYSTTSLKQQMEVDGHIYYICMVDDKPCGYVSIQQEGADLFHLQKIYVLPEYQGNSLGRVLFNTAVNHIKERHPAPCDMELNVNRNNKALGFYEHLGMKRLRKGDFDIGNGYYMNDYIMGLKL